jgi:hypothetical protein
MGSRFILQGWVNEVTLSWRGSSSLKKKKMNSLDGSRIRSCGVCYLQMILNQIGI